MADSTVGNRPEEFKESIDFELRQEKIQVRVWRARIRRSGVLLNIPERVMEADKGDRYFTGQTHITGTKARQPRDRRGRQGKRDIYIRYLLSLIRAMFRRTLPAVPAPRVEARNELADQPVTPPDFIRGPDGEPILDDDGQPTPAPPGPTWSDIVRQLVDLTFNSAFSNVPAGAREAQWDDARYGVGFVKTVWHITNDPAEPRIEQDDNRVALEVDHVQEENDSPLEARISDSDIDYVHLEIHRPLLEQLRLAPLASPSFVAMRDHVEQHQARLVKIRRERPQLKRVPAYKFVYDTDVEWDERAWECEERSVRIADMIKWGWRNINEQNIVAEVKEGEGNSTPFIDRTAVVYDIHDRTTGERRVISAKGPEEGRYLHKGPWPYGSLDIYIPLVFIDFKPEQTHGIAIIEAATDILVELADVDFSIRRHRETHANYKILGPKGAGSDDVKAGLNNPDQRFVDVPVEWLAGFKEYAPPPIPSTLLDDRARLISELRRLLSIDAQDTGAANPHAVSATESFNRAEAKDETDNDRQTIMGEFLSKVAKNFIVLYREFATMDISVKVMGQEGPVWQKIRAQDIPEDLDIYLDITGETEASKALMVTAWTQFIEFLKTTPVPIKWEKVKNVFGRRLGIRHPEDFRADGPEGPEHILPSNGAVQPGLAEVPQLGAAQETAPFRPSISNVG